jgi:hypothetical protein
MAREGTRTRFARRPPRAQLERDHAERVDVRGGRDARRFGLHLLRAHVLRSAEQLSGAGGELGGTLVAAGEPRDAEVQHDRTAVCAHDDVRGLQVAVHDALGMRVLHRVADGGEEPEPRIEPQPPAPRVLVERHALYVPMVNRWWHASRAQDLAQAHDAGDPVVKPRTRPELKPLAKRGRDRARASSLIANAWPLAVTTPMPPRPSSRTSR